MHAAYDCRMQARLRDSCHWQTHDCVLRGSLPWQVNVLAKRLTPERVRIEFEEQRLHIVITSPEGELEFELDTELYDEVCKTSSCLSASKACACSMPGVVHAA